MTPIGTLARSNSELGIRNSEFRLPLPKIVVSGRLGGIPKSEIRNPKFWDRS
jgi:hypothetical protein